MLKTNSDNWAIVRVWLPKNSKNEFVVAHSAENVGHASLETSELYASFWPDWENAKKGNLLGALMGEAEGALIPKLEIDIKLEGNKQPDVVVVLYTLDTKEIKKAFDKFKSSGAVKNWSLLGSNVFNVFNKGGGQSCSGLVYDLLNAGGIRKLNGWSLIEKLWTVAPDGIARVSVEAAQTKEESTAAYSNPLPKGVTKRIVKPNYDLNPHTNSVGYFLGQSKTK